MGYTASYYSMQCEPTNKHISLRGRYQVYVHNVTYHMHVWLNRERWLSTKFEIVRPLANSTPVYRFPDNGPLARYVKLRVVHVPGMPGTFSPPPRVSYHDIHHGTCVTLKLVAGKTFPTFRRMCNLQLYVSGKRPMKGVMYVNTKLRLRRYFKISEWRFTVAYHTCYVFRNEFS